jgi:hypothetical protein
MNEHDVTWYVDEAKMISHCAPIFFLPHAEARPCDITANGTTALLDTGQRKVLVTCFHVWDEFQIYSDKIPTACLCTIFSNGFRFPIGIPATALIDSDEGLDLAVIEATPEIWDMGYKEFYRIERWPIPKAMVGSPIAFVGFPGEARITNEHGGNFQYSAFGVTVAGVSDRKIVIAGKGEPGNLLDNDGNKLPPMLMEGLSGAPAYARDGKARFLLAGFVQMGKTSSDDLFLTHASVLNRDGTLNK